MTDQPVDRGAWARQNIRKLMRMGVSISDAMMVTERILKRTPPGGDLEAVPNDEELAQMAVVTDADIADAKADWLQHASREWRPLLSAIVEEPTE